MTNRQAMFGGIMIGILIASVSAVMLYLIHASPDARLVTVKQVQSYEDWCWGKGGSVNYNSAKYYTGCTVPPKGMNQ